MCLPVEFGRRVIAPHLGPFLAQHPALELDIDLSDRLDDLPALSLWAERATLARPMTASPPCTCGAQGSAVASALFSQFGWQGVALVGAGLPGVALLIFLANARRG